ncbi:hypothetical protein PUN28_017494 [Cardiocondyla obscurior]|uniref:Uncharacterized protein n=1 Tax=Cardiocondyla obscurior TaxID=286306 RepID=A0AAW2ELE2_9HYME
MIRSSNSSSPPARDRESRVSRTQNYFPEIRVGEEIIPASEGWTKASAKGGGRREGEAEDRVLFSPLFFALPSFLFSKANAARWTSVMASDRGTAEDTNIISRRGSYGRKKRTRPKFMRVTYHMSGAPTRAVIGADVAFFLPGCFNFAQSTSPCQTVRITRGLRFHFAGNRYIATSSEIKTLGLFPTCADGRPSRYSVSHAMVDDYAIWPRFRITTFKAEKSQLQYPFIFFFLTKL